MNAPSDEGRVRLLPTRESTIRRILEDPSIRGVTRFVYAQLCDLALHGTTGWFSERELSELLHGKPRSHQRFLTELAAAGLIRRRRDPKSRRLLYAVPHLAKDATAAKLGHYLGTKYVYVERLVDVLTADMS